MHDFWHLHGFDWLSGLAPDETERLRSTSDLRKHPAGDLIFGPARRPRSVYLLERGLVRIYRMSPLGTEVTFGFVRPGEAFGEIAAFSDAARESFALAMRASIVWRCPRRDFQAIFRRHPRVAFAVTRQIGNRLKRIESRVEDLVFHNARVRLARILLELAADFGRQEGEALAIDLPVNQTELASLIGLTRQTLNEVLRTLEIEKVISRSRRGRTVIVRQAALQSICTQGT